MRVYVDPTTDLPVRVEEDSNGEPKAGVVMSDFECGVEVDPKFVSLIPPAGYRHATLPVREPTSPPAAIAEGPRSYASQTKSLPDEMGGLSSTLVLWQHLGERGKTERLRDWCAWMKTDHEISGAWEGLREAIEALDAIQVHYLGKGLEAGDGSKLVAWWRAEKPGRAIVVYDDFSWKKIDEPAAAPSP